MQTLGTKQIMQPLGINKKIMQPLGTKRNHASSQDKKCHNLWGQKNLQPLGTKNYATSRDKKIRKPLKTKKS